MSHRPDVLTHRDPAGRWVARCLTCKEASRPTSHKPAAEQWRKEHIKAATTAGESR